MRQSWPAGQPLREEIGMEKKKRWQVPHTYVIVMAFVIFMALLTYVVPGGEYARVYDAAADRELVDPNSFTYCLLYTSSPCSITPSQ